MEPLTPAELARIGRNWWGPRTITYSFYVDDDLPLYWSSNLLRALFGADRVDVTAISAGQRSAFDAAIGLWTSFANINMQEETLGIGDIFVAGIPYRPGPGVQISESGQAAVIPVVLDSDADAETMGDMWLRTNGLMNESLMSPEKVGFFIILHEVGHTLGLAHPHLIVDGKPVHDQWWDSNRYTVMSYIGLNGRPYDYYQTREWAVAPMLLDIAAIQSLYGANPTTNAGDGNVYKFGTEGWPIQAIWDAGGADDIIDGSLEERQLFIDLNSGGESRADSRRGRDYEIHIAFTPVDSDGNVIQEYVGNFIENANGGFKNDRIIGNEGANKLKGGGGNDVIHGERGAHPTSASTAGAADEITGGLGDDVLFGGVGHDVYIYNTLDGADTIGDIDGVIRINGVDLSGDIFWHDSRPRGYGLRAWRSEILGAEVRIVLMSGSMDDGTAELRIEGAALGGSAHSITVVYFNNGELGLDLDTSIPVEIEDDLLALREGNAITIPFTLGAPAGENQWVRISVNAALSDQLRLVTGAETLEFNSDGTLDIQLAAGQSAFRYSLVSVGDVDNSASQINLGVALLDENGQIIETSQDTTTITFEAVEEPSFMSPSTYPNSYFGNDDDNGAVNTVHNGYFEGEPLLVETYGGNDNIFYNLREFVPAPVVVDAGDGHDKVWVSGYDIKIDGGAGNDWLGAQGANTMIGGAGSDLILSEDFVGREVEADRLYGDQEVSLVEAIDLGESEPGSTLSGDVLSGSWAASDDLLIGTSARDVLAGGGGMDAIAGGAGDDLILGDSYVFARWEDGRSPTWSTFTWDWQPVVTSEDGTTVYSYELSNYVEYSWSDENGNTLTSNHNLIDANSAVGAADTVHAGAGNDLVFAGDGDDFVDAGTGGDVVFGGVGNDRLLGGDGDDVLQAGDPDDVAGQDFVDGGDGNDLIWGSHGSDVLYGGSDDDTLVGDADALHGGEDYLNGESGNDDLYGGARSDILIGGDGNDFIEGDRASDPTELHGDDYLDGGAGEDMLIGGGGADTLMGGGDDDTLIGDMAGLAADGHGDDYIDAGAGNDVAAGSGGSDTIYGGTGDDQLHGDSNDTPFEGMGDDYLDGGDGNDELVGYGGSDVLIGGGGDDRLYGELSDAEPGFDDRLDGGNGADLLFGHGGNDELIGGDGDDQLAGGAGDDELYGGAGDDIIEGDDGNDVLVGGAGADVLSGGDGDDVYVFSSADLLVNGLLADGVFDTAGNNLIVFTDMSLDSFTWVQGVQPGSINLMAADGTIGLVIRGAISGSVTTFEFAGGWQESASSLIGNYYDAAADQTSDADGATLLGGIRDDTIQALGANATLAGGRGDDVLVGGSGATTYLFERGDGQDSITDRSTYLQFGSVNRLQLGWGIDAWDFRVAVNAGANSAVLELGGGDQVTLNDFSFSDPVGGARTIDEIRLADDTSITWDQLLAQNGVWINNEDDVANYTGTRFDDVIEGADIDETINAGDGADIIDAGGGNDVLSGGQGSDIYILRQGSGADTINNFDSAADKVDRLFIDASIAASDVEFYRIGQSLLVRVRGSSDQVVVSDYFGTDGLDEIVFANGTVYTVANVPLQEQPENVLTYNLGDGASTFTIADPVGIVLDTLRFGADIDPSSIDIRNADGDLQIILRQPDGSYSPDYITIVGGFTNPDARLDRIEFAAAPDLILNAEDILYRANLPTEDDDEVFGTEQGDVIDGLGGRDTIHGLGGNDVLYGGYWARLYGGDGDDTLHSNTGNSELLDGGAGNDTFIINAGGGGEVITGFDTDMQSTDVLLFGRSIDPDSLRFARSDESLSISYDDPSSSSAWVVVRDFFASNRTGQTIDEIRFVDQLGLVLVRDDILARLFGATDRADRISGSDADDTLLGQGGDDTLIGNAGDDDLDGGVGNDSLQGDIGNDTYRFGFGSGIDDIQDTFGANCVVLAGNVSPADVTLIRTYVDTDGTADLIIRLGDNDQLRIASYYLNPSLLSTIEFADGTTWTAADIAARVIDRTGDVDTQVGTSGNDAYNVDNTLDVVQEPGATGGVDIVNSTASYRLPNHVENLTLLGTEHVFGTGNSLNNTIIGNSGDNILSGGTGADTLIGGLGDDTYIVNGAGDTDQSNDVVMESTGEGYDTMIFDRAYGGQLSANVERLIYRPGNTWYANTPAVARGNELDNEIIIDTSGAFSSRPIILDGGAGADRLVGSDFEEIYIVDNAGDQVLELGGANSEDTIRSYVTYTLPTLVERLELLGSNAIDGAGNDFDNVLVGSTNSAANVLTGGLGDDTYYLGQGDSIVELAGGGSDTIVIDYNTAEFHLDDYQNIENVTVDSITDAVYGDANDNVIRGNSGGNQLHGGDGADSIYDGNGTSADNDVLHGGGGDDRLFSNRGIDTLDGGSGDDELNISGASNSGGATILFGLGDGYDTVNNYRGVSTVLLDAEVTIADVRVTRDGQVIHIYVGTTERLSIIAYDDADSWAFGPAFGGIDFADSTHWGAQELQAAIQAGQSQALPSAAADVLIGTSGRDRIDALGGDDQLMGGLGEDSLTGGRGNDLLIGGGGADSYHFAASFGRDILRDTEAGQTEDGAIDRVVFDATISRSEMVFSRSDVNSADLWITRRGTGDRLTVRDFFGDPTTVDTIEQFVFADGTVITADSLRGVPIVEGTNGADTLQAGPVGSTINGYAGDDALTGGVGADTLNGGTGADTMSGGAGDDRYFVDDAGDSIVEAVGGGEDTVISSISWELSANVENLRLEGVGPLDGVGNDLNNRLVGNDSANVLDGRGGADTMDGGAGHDVYIVDNSADVIVERLADGYDTVNSHVSYTLGEFVEALELLGTADVTGTGNAANNYIRGNAGSNHLNGAAGADTMVGAQGDDTYVVDDIGDIVVESENEGADTIEAFVSYRAPDHVEGVRLMGSSAIGATGNALANTIFGNAADNTLDGDVGADHMIGGAGNDTYVVDDDGDLTIELAGEGDDFLISSVNRALVDHIERLRLTGTAVVATGNALNNVIEGNAQGNVIDGGLGADRMSGGAGDDLYLVDDAGDVVVEAQNAGTDTVRSYVDFAMGSSQIENLELLGTAVQGFGNSLSNRLIGNALANQLDAGAGNDWLDGGEGIDSMTGGSGDEIYIVDHTNDLVVELANQGTDRVRSSATYTLGNNVEDLELTGSADINGTGNSGANRIGGNVGNNTLNGGAGADTLSGGAGSDLYIVDNAGDTVIEIENGGNDTVQASVSFVLSDHVENLTLTGSGSLSGTGNALGNLLTGNSGANTLNGGAGNDILIGGAGNDSMAGGTGDDSYFATEAGDTVIEQVNGGTDSVTSSVAFVLGQHVENLTLTGTNAINATGNDQSNVLVGNAGANTIDGGAGADTMRGGAGDDTYVVDNAEDVVDEEAGEGIDHVQASISFTLSEHVENLTLTGTGVINGTGNELGNVITGNALANVLSGRAGNDTYVIQNGDDSIMEGANEGTDLVLSSVTHTLTSNVENLVLTGTLAINGTGNALANSITGNAGDNVLDGGAGDDILAGGAGNDTYIIDSAFDVLTEGSNAGTDTVISTVSHTLAANFENLTLTGTANINAVGNGVANVLMGNAGKNALDGGAGADLMSGGAGDDVYVVGSSTDQVFENANEGTDLVQTTATFTLGAHVENLTIIGTGSISGTGNALDNVLIGGAGGNTLIGLEGNDTLDGGGGNDRMEGGLGDDVYIVDSTGDTVIEAAGAGLDQVYASATFTLAANVENLTLTGAGAINGTGNDLANIIIGNDAANTLNGNAGADALSGGGGDDIYVVDNVADLTIEVAGAGTDTVQAHLSWMLADHLENLVLMGAALNGTGNDQDNTLTGNNAANELNGGGGNDVLIGGTGADLMIGGSGDDTFHVDNGGDVVIELEGDGIDTVQSTIAYTLGADIENLTVVGSGSINATGNDGANVIVGNAGNNVIDGRGGADQMIGGAGNDTYMVDDAGDVIVEAADMSVDLVQSNVSYVLSANVENLTLTGTADIDAIGNTLANVLTGNAGINVLTGGAGDDSYVVDHVSDVVVELANEGIDTIRSSISLILGADFENLTLLGSGQLSGTGNDLDNTLIGNNAANVLIGGLGNDVLNGGGGADQMTGGLGDDTYVVDHASDVVNELPGEGTDTVQASMNYTLGAQLENLTLIGTSGYSATGNDGDNILIGNNGANILNGGLGADTMIGGGGNDTYVVDSLDDTVAELLNQGTDTVRTDLSYTLGENVENLTLTGSADVNGTGNEMANVMTGNAGGNVLAGGFGDDTYVVDNLVDILVEAANEGTDLVQASISYTLGDHIENLTLTGTAGNSATGNDLNNVLIGNSGANTLIGGAGNDTLNGGAGADTMGGGVGDDIYVVDNAGDIVTEASGAGIDTMQSTVAYTLGENLENLTLGGSGLISGTGNALDNILIGNNAANTLIGSEGNDTLNGGAGADTMIGGAGNDSYIVDHVNDVVNEAAGEGLDSMTIHVARTLAADVELLFIGGTSGIAGTGNEHANLLRGNAGNNTLIGGGGTDLLEGGNGTDVLTTTGANGLLNGGAGNDTLNGSASNDLLIGGAGNDTIVTGAGADIIVFNRGDGQDTVAVSNAQDNVLSIGGAGYADLLFRKNGNNLILSMGTDQITFTDYYANVTNRSIRDLQIVIDGTAEYDPLSGDALRDNAIETFDFEGLVAAFDSARAANPSLTSWALSNALLTEHLGGSNIEAYGGDLAYRYNRFGTLSDVAFIPALGILSDVSFGTSTQALRSLAALQDESVRLS